MYRLPRRSVTAHMRHIACDHYRIYALPAQPRFQLGAGKTPWQILLNQQVMGAIPHFWMKFPLWCATLKEWLVGLGKGVLDHYTRNIPFCSSIHDLQNIAQVSLRMGDGEQAGKILILLKMSL